jgi:hypothetical protein
MTTFHLEVSGAQLAIFDARLANPFDGELVPQRQYAATEPDPLTGEYRFGLLSYDPLRQADFARTSRRAAARSIWRTWSVPHWQSGASACASVCPNFVSE